MSFTENLYLKRQIQKLQEENDILLRKIKLLGEEILAQSPSPSPVPPMFPGGNPPSPSPIPKGPLHPIPPMFPPGPKPFPSVTNTKVPGTYTSPTGQKYTVNQDGTITFI